MMSKVRFLMIGVGGMGQSHIRNILNLSDAEIVGFVDPSAQSIERAKSYSVSLKELPTFANLDDAFKAVEADAAVIVTPHSQHFEQGMACLSHGLNVLMEKPFVSGSENARKIIEYADKVGRHLVVSYQRHLQGPYVYLRNLIQSGELGEIRFISAYQAQSWLESQRGTWRQNKALSCGGQLNDSGSHLIDVVLWLTGLEPQAVLANIENRGTEVDIDTGLIVRFEGGAMCTFNVVGSANLNWWEDVSIHGTAGLALYRNGELLVSKGLNQPVSKVLEAVFPESSNVDENFVNFILGRLDSPAAPSECGYRVARLTEAAWESAEQNRWVPFNM